MAKRNRNTLKKRNPDDEKKYLPLTNDNIILISAKVEKDPKYGPQGEEIEKYLCENPENKERNKVIHKILLIDFTNSTNLRFTSHHANSFSIFKLADKIIEWDIDERIKNGDHDVVDSIAQFENANIFSFATKYCFYHSYYVYKSDNYSIFDKIVVNTIPQYLDITQKEINKHKDMGYKKYHELINEIIKTYNLNVPFVRRKLDHFFWYPNRPIIDNEKNNVLS